MEQRNKWAGPTYILTSMQFKRWLHRRRISEFITTLAEFSPVTILRDDVNFACLKMLQRRRISCDLARIANNIYILIWQELVFWVVGWRSVGDQIHVLTDRAYLCVNQRLMTTCASVLCLGERAVKLQRPSLARTCLPYLSVGACCHRPCLRATVVEPTIRPPPTTNKNFLILHHVLVGGLRVYV